MQYLSVVSLLPMGSGERSRDADEVVQTPGSKQFTEKPVPWARNWETRLTDRHLDRHPYLLRSMVGNGFSSLFLFPLTDRHVARALRVLIVLNSPEHLHLQLPPTPLPIGMGAYLSSALGYSFVITCLTADVAFPLCASGLLLNAWQSASFQL